jgi:hypothetical protein
MVQSIDQFKSLINNKNGLVRSNLFRVKLPSLPGASSEEMNILCKDIQLPGRQILTNERQIGMQNVKVPYGYAVQDVSMTFHVLNDYGVKEYFETWQNLAVNQNRYEVGYQKGVGGYARQVEIEQFRKVKRLPRRFTNEFRSETGLKQFLPKLSDFEIVQDVFGLQDQLNDLVIYKCKLIDAYPTGLNAIQLNNELDGVVELNIQMSYTNWETPFVLSPSNIKDAISTKISSTIVGFVDELNPFT